MWQHLNWVFNVFLGQLISQNLQDYVRSLIIKKYFSVMISRTFLWLIMCLDF